MDTPQTPATPNAQPDPHKVGAVPTRDQAQAAMWVSIGDAWQEYPHLTLVGTTAAEFKTAAAAQAAKLKARREADDARPLLSQRLDTIQGYFRASLPYLKGDLLKLFKKEGVEAAYAAFGLEQRDGVWQFPAERLTAQDQYDKLVAALAAQGLTAGEYGSDILAPLAAEFRTKYAELVKIDQQTSNAVGQKNLGKPYLKRTTKSLRYIIQGNYPDTYEQVFRAWGIQREKFGQG